MTGNGRRTLVRGLPALALASVWILGVAACGAKTGASEVTDIPAQRVLEVSRGEKAPLLLDVRTPEEYASGHVPGAINIPHSEVQSRLAEIEPYREREVIVYCELGGRASIAAGILRAAGFEHVEHMQGDMSGWREKNLPVER